MTALNDPEIERFLRASTLERYHLLVNRSLAPKLKVYLGEQAHDELVRLATEAISTHKAHLGIDFPPNLIFVPGVMGSLLLSSKRGGIWWIDARTRHHIKDLKLAHGGRDDADPAAKITPCTVDITYEPFFSAIIKREDFNHEIFAYDWRKSLEWSTSGLRDKIDEAYVNNGNAPVHIVAHSMGGLLVRAALMRYGTELWRKVDRIVFIGTPHYGSSAIAGYLKNHLWGFELLSILGLYLDRDTFRSLWGVLSLLPAPRGIYPGTREGDQEPWMSGNPNDPYQHPCVNFDMYRAAEWKLELTPEQTGELQEALNTTARFHRELYDSHQRLKQEQRDRMAVIAGVGYETLFRLAYEERFWGLWTKMEKVKSRLPGTQHRDGDGRVPIASAALEDVGELRYVKGVHGELPMIQAVYEDVFRWLKREPMVLPNTPKGALTAHLAGPPASDAPALTRSTAADPATGDPGYWDLNGLPPNQERAAEIEEQLGKELLPEFNKIRLL